MNHATDSADALLGGIMLSPHRFGEIEPDLAAEDFVKPSHQAIWEAMRAVHAEGRIPDIVTLADRLGDDWKIRLLDVQARGLASAWAQRVAEIKTAAARRRAIGIAEALAAELATGTAVDDAIGQALTGLAAVETPGAPKPKELHYVPEFRADTVEAPWIIPGLLRAGWRVLVVGPEGLGKSMVVQQVAVIAGRGLHPFTAEVIDPVRALIVDLENPDDVVAARFDRLDAKAGTDSWLWHRPGGIDLRRRRDRMDFEAVLGEVRPQVVALGPLYKSFRTAKGESHEQAAGEVQATFDDLRTRFGFGLLLEHHAPHGSGGVRDLRPEGSSLWLRWPEIGLKLLPSDPSDRKHVKVGRFRYDRVENQWPDALRWGRGMPWVPA